MSQLIEVALSPNGPVQVSAQLEPVNRAGISEVLQSDKAGSSVIPVAPDQRRKGKSMSRRSGQKGQVVRKGDMWHIRFYVDVPGQQKRQRKSLPIGPAVGKEKLTKPEAIRKGSEIIEREGVNTAAHLERSRMPVISFGDAAKSWRDGHLNAIRRSLRTAG
jgi:hypothetical protein